MKGYSERFERVKRVNLVEFLRDHYGLEFRRTGGEWSCLSPFTQEETASFFVRMQGDHWLFKDFSSDEGGSIIDFVLRYEGYSEPLEALEHIEKQLDSSMPESISSPNSGQSVRSSKQYNLNSIHEQI